MRRSIPFLVTLPLLAVAAGCSSNAGDAGAMQSEDLILCPPGRICRPVPINFVSNVSVQTPNPPLGQPASVIVTFTTTFSSIATLALSSGASVSDAAPATQHTLTIGGLQQATTYSYTITAGNGSASGTFKTGQTILYNPNANKIRFVGPGGAVIASQGIYPSAGAENAYFGPGDLGALPSDCASDVTVTFSRSPLGQSRYSEAQLIARDPATYASDLVALSDSAIKGGAWVEQTSQPLDLPGVAAIPYPSSPSTPSLWVSVPLSTSAFWPGGVDASNPQAVAAATCQHPATGAWDRTGAVKAVAVYQEPACAASVALDDLLAQVTTGLFSSFNGATGVENAVDQYTVASSTIGRGDPSNANDVRAGFVLAFHYSGDVAGVGNEVWGMSQYRFGLSNGVLAIDQYTPVRLASSGIWGWKMEDGLRSGLANDLPQRITSAAQAQQMVSEPFFLECGAPTDCGSSADALAALVTVANAQAAGVANPTVDQVNHMKCALGSPAGCAAIGRSASLANWACAPSATDSSPVCQFVPPAKRLNAMSDELQLVWYDDAEVDNPAFALRVAGNTAGAADRMCTAQPHSVASSVGRYARGFAVAGKLP